MNTKLIAFLAAASMSMAAAAQTSSSSTTPGTSNTGTPTQGQSTANSGEQNASTMQNNSNAPNATPPKTAKDRKMHKEAKNKVDCDAAHTDGNATAPAHARADCDNNTSKTQR